MNSVGFDFRDAVDKDVEQGASTGVGCSTS